MYEKRGEDVEINNINGKKYVKKRQLEVSVKIKKCKA